MAQDEGIELTASKVSHSGDVVVGEEPLCEACVILAVQPSGMCLPLAKCQPDADSSEEVVSVLAEGGGEVGGGPLLLDEVVRVPNACTVALLSRLPGKDEKYTPLTVNEGLWVTTCGLA
jgi:hypothetical protein